MKVERLPIPGLVLKGLVLVLVSITLTGCTLDRICAQQEKASRYLPELTQGISYGQTMVVAEDGLYRIDLGTATFARVNTAPVIFHLRESVDALEDLRTVILPGEQIENSRPTSITFEPIRTPVERSYYFFTESPAGVAGNAITIYVNDVDQYNGGSALMNGQAAQGDLAFTAYCQQEYSLSGIATDFIQRVKQDVAFAVFYLLMLVLLVYACFRKVKKSSHG